MQEILDADLVKEIRAAYLADPILCARQLFPHWFPRPMPWFHRGIIAIILRRTDFLLNFSEPNSPEIWDGGTKHWTKKDLAKLVRHFRYKANPADEKSPELPIFRVRFAADGRTPVAIDMAIGTHTNLIIPRGFSKTTIINFCNVYKTLHGLTKFTVVISEASTHAEDQLATIGRELSSNARLVALYGDLKPDRTDDESWGAKSFETRTGVKFVARGRGAQIRGLNKFGDRPDTIILDDVEDKESVATETQREKVLSWFVSDVSEALPRNREGQIYTIGTILHRHALLPTLAKDPQFTTIQLGALIDTGRREPTGEFEEDGVTPKLRPVLEPLWDDAKAGLTMEKIMAKKASFAAKGKLYEFGLEILSSIRLQDKLKFRPEYIRYKTMERKDFVAVAIHIDPAISDKPGTNTKKDADYCSIAVVGVQENGHKHVLDMWLKQGAPMSEQQDMYVQMKIKWDATHCSAESTAFQAAWAQSLREQLFIYAKKYGPKAYFEIVDVWPQTNKLVRVEGILQPIMASGYLTFQQIWPELEVMFNGWPDEKLDGPDSIAAAIANLDPYAALSYGDQEKLAESMEDNPDHDFEAPCAAGSGIVP